MDFNKLVRENKKNIQNVIRLVTKEDNEDLEQEVYVRVLKNADKYQEKGTFKGWVTTIAKNISKDYLKSASYKARENSVTEEDSLVQIADKKEVSPELRLIKNERQQRIINAVNSLKPKFREVVLMCEIYGYSYEDCAKKLNCPLGTVKSRLFNAKKELSILLADLI